MPIEKAWKTTDGWVANERLRILRGASKPQSLAHRASFRTLNAASLAERNRIARDIHDTLAQGFTGVILQLRAAEDALVSGDAALAEARRSVRVVRPKVLEVQALPAALDTMVRKMTRDTRIEPKVSVVGQPRPLAEECEDEIIRIVQESLTNTIKHANAQRFEVKILRFSETTLRKVAPVGAVEGKGLSGYCHDHDFR